MRARGFSQLELHGYPGESGGRVGMRGERLFDVSDTSRTDFPHGDTRRERTMPFDCYP